MNVYLSPPAVDALRELRTHINTLEANMYYGKHADEADELMTLSRSLMEFSVRCATSADHFRFKEIE